MSGRAVRLVAAAAEGNRRRASKLPSGPGRIPTTRGARRPGRTRRRGSRAGARPSPVG